MMDQHRARPVEIDESTSPGAALLSDDREEPLRSCQYRGMGFAEAQPWRCQKQPVQSPDARGKA
jgi:hypothetical protein